MNARCTSRSPNPPRPSSWRTRSTRDGNVTGKKLFHDFTDLVGDEMPGPARRPHGRADGTIFTSGPGGILVLSKEGKRLGRISDGKATANCKFGDDGKTLYLTSHNMLARIRLNIAGF